MLLCLVVSSAQRQSNESQDSHEMKAPTSPSTTTDKPRDSPTAKTVKQAQEIEEEEYNFLTDRLPALSEDEFNNLGEDANPLHFLKQSPLLLEQQQPQQPDIPAPVAPLRAGGSPIYITIPIYISTAGKLPLTLTVGDQELSVNKLPRKNASNPSQGKRKPSTKAPNSHYNRLLQEIEAPKRRTTNRHRSQPRSHIYATKDRRDSVRHHPKQ
ncbi:hypothetical protein KR018_004682, partial [Drosophila ironensis]